MRFSLNARVDHVKQQGSATAPWETYEHQTYSAGVEDDFRLSDKWQVTGGFSVDRLKKQTGGSKTSLNPIAGIRFAPSPDMGLHLSLSRKSRFPSMRSLYSTSGGNPALQDEIGTTYEAGASWRGPFEGSLAVFATQVENLIFSVRQPTGFNTYVNIGKASLKGFETEVAKSLGPSTPAFPIRSSIRRTRTRTGGWTSYRSPRSASSRGWAGPTTSVCPSGDSPPRARRSSSAAPKVTAPGYVVANAIVREIFRGLFVYVKVENIFDKAYVTEPGYPMASRRFEAGSG